MKVLPPWVLQITGIAFFIAFSAVWVLTGRESILLITSSGSLILFAGYKEPARKLAKKLLEKLPPEEES